MNSTENIQQPTRRFCRSGRKKFLFIPLFIAVLVVVKAAIVMFLWNDLATELFHGPVVSFVQAIEIIVLAKVLFGFGGRGMMGGMRRHRFGHHRFEEKLANLSPEERERFKADLKRGC